MAFTLVSLSTTCVICYGIYYIVKWYLKRRRLYELASTFHGPPALPFIGNAHQFSGDGVLLLEKLTDLSRKYPSPCRAWLGPRLLIIISDPEQAKTVLVSPSTLKKGEIVDFGRPLVGTGLFTAPVAKWKVHRKLIQPTFNTKILDTFVEVFAVQSKILTEQLEENLDGPEFEIFHSIASCTLDMVCETAMGVKVGAQSNENHYYVEAIEKTIAGFCKRIFTLWMHPDFIYYRTQLGKDEQKYIKFLHTFTHNVIDMRRKELNKSKTQPGTTVDDDGPPESTSRRKAFLDHLLTLPEGSMTDEALREEVDTMVMAAHDTTGVTLSYVMLMLASHPDIQDKVYQEIYEIYGDDDIDKHPVTPKDLPRMKYLERVIKETLRVFPIAPFFAREVTEDLDIGEHIIPSGSTVVIGILLLHRNEKYWPDALKFDPDRFLPEEVAKRHPYSFIAFSGGPRNCIGINYGLMSMKTLVTTILRKYTLKKDNIVPVKDIRLKMESLLKTVDPIKLRLERRIKN